MQKLKTISARLSPDVVKKLEALMEVYQCNQTEAIKQAILLAEIEKKPVITTQVYHAEMSEAGDMVKCPLGKNKGLWVRNSVCQKCQETQCNIKG